MKKLQLLVLFFIAAVASAKTPEEVVRESLDVMKTSGLGGIAKLMHPEELTKFREMMAPMIELALKEREGREVFGSFASPTDKSKIGTFSDESFMRKFLDWAGAQAPELNQALKTATVQVIGHVKENDMHHVVTRMKMSAGGIDVEQLSVTSTRDFQGEPKLMLTGEIKNLAAALKQQMK